MVSNILNVFHVVLLFSVFAHAGVERVSKDSCTPKPIHSIEESVERYLSTFGGTYETTSENESQKEVGGD
jgi:hypothetical protein